MTEEKRTKLALMFLGTAFALVGAAMVAGLGGAIVILGLIIFISGAAL